MNIRCALVDDNLNDIKMIKNTIFQLCFHTDTSIKVEAFQDSQDKRLLEQYDLYIFDIDMPNINGFDLAHIIYEKYPKATIIFCTMHDNLVYDSFKLNAFYFVRKNNLKEDLLYSIKKYLSSFQNKGIYIAKNANGLIKIEMDSIIYFEVVHNNIFIHLENNAEIKERKSLQKVLSELNDYGFIQVGKSFLVNLEHISTVNDYKLTLTNKQIIDIPKSQYAKVRQNFLSHYAR